MTIKICHVTSAHRTEDVRILKKECASLAQNDEYSVTIVGQGENSIYNKVNIFGVGNIPNSRFKRMTQFAKRVVQKAIEIDADIYHLHDPELLRYALKLKKIGKRVIFDSHENVMHSIDDKTYMPLLIRKVFKLYYGVLQKKVLTKVDGIIIVSPQMAELYKVFNDNIALITNYPIIEIDKEQSKHTDAVKGRFVFAGGITEQWSHREIINAIETIDGVEYYLFGAADEKYLNDLKKLNGWKKVHYGGLVSFETVQKEMEKAHATFALLKPSKNSFYMQGTLGNTKLFESMGKGTPVIATGFDYWKPVIEDNHCGFCADPNSEEDIKDKIYMLLQLNNDEYNRMSQNCKEVVSKKYNWEVQAKALLEFYEKVIDRRRY